MKTIVLKGVTLTLTDEAKWEHLSPQARQELIGQVRRGLVKPVVLDWMGRVIEGEEVVMAAIQAKVKSLTFVVVAITPPANPPSVPPAENIGELIEASSNILKVTEQECWEWSQSQVGPQPVLSTKLDRFCVFATTPAELQRVLAAMQQVDPSRLANRKTSAKSLIRMARTQQSQKLVSQSITELKRPEVQLRFGDFRALGEQIPDNSMDGVGTDPPYDRASIELYYESAKLAMRVLKPGSVYYAYAGKMFLPQVYAALERSGLEFVWQCAIMHNGGHNVTWPRRMISAYKPILIYRKPGSDTINWPLIMDVCREGRQEQNLHPWQQALAESEYFIRKLFVPGSLILDPMMGSGTTIVASINCGMNVIGIEQDPITFETAKKRVEDHLVAIPLPPPSDPSMRKEGA